MVLVKAFMELPGAQDGFYQKLPSVPSCREVRLIGWYGSQLFLPVTLPSLSTPHTPHNKYLAGLILTQGLLMRERALTQKALSPVPKLI